MVELQARLRGFEADHEPDGWPAIQMRDVSALLDHIAQLDATNAALELEFDHAFLEWCADRFVYVYGADPAVDYVRKLRRMARMQTS